MGSSRRRASRASLRRALFPSCRTSHPITSSDHSSSSTSIPKPQSTMQSPVLLLLALTSTVSAHYSLTYPPWRGDSMETQWTYPCDYPLLTLSHSS